MFKINLITRINFKLFKLSYGVIIMSAYIDPNFLKFKSILEDCWNNGRYSFDQCSDLEQELLARYYYFSLDSKERGYFLEYLEEQLMDMLANDKYGVLIQRHMVEMLIDFYGDEIDQKFKSNRGYYVSRYNANTGELEMQYVG